MRALITGITGQDGAYLARLLLDKGYEVWGAARRSASGGAFNRLLRLDIVPGDVRMVSFDLLDFPQIQRAVELASPDEVYNLAAQSFVGESFCTRLTTADMNALGPLRLLEAVQRHRPDARFYQASSSEMFGNAGMPATGYHELSPMHPRSPYGYAKLFAYWAVRNFREAYGMHCSNGILFNHESPLRGEEFVTRKIVQGLLRIKMGEQNSLFLGNLDARRDWGFAGEYVEAMWLMLQQEKPDDYVIATGHTYSVRDFVETAIAEVGLRGTVEDYVCVDPQFYRAAEVDVLLGDSTKARHALKWEPKTDLRELVRIMVTGERW